MEADQLNATHLDPSELVVKTTTAFLLHCSSRSFDIMPDV
jgi:hypothetical protein